MARDRDFMTTGEAAIQLQMHPDTLRRQCAKGKVPGAVRPYEGSPWRIPRDWVRKLKDQMRGVVRR